MTPSATCALSFSEAFVDVARSLGGRLSDAGLAVRFDGWGGGGGVPAVQLVDTSLDGVDVVVVVLTPSDLTRTWVSQTWHQRIGEPAARAAIPVLAVRAVECEIPRGFAHRSFADLARRDEHDEFERLVRSIADVTGADGVAVDDDALPRGAIGPSAATPAEPAVVVEVGTSLRSALGGAESEPGAFDTGGQLLADGLFYETGIALPIPVFRVDHARQENSVQISIYGVPEAEFDVRHDRVLVNSTTETMSDLGLAAEPGRNPATGGVAAWIPADAASAAEAAGFTTWDAPDYVILRVAQVLRQRRASFIDLDWSQSLLDRLADAFPRTVREVVPTTVPLHVFTEVLRRLVHERVHLRHAPGILMSLADHGRFTTAPHLLTELVRHDLRRIVSQAATGRTGALPAFTLDAEIEDLIIDHVHEGPNGTFLDLDDDRVVGLVTVLRDPYRLLPDGVRTPAIVTDARCRAVVMRLMRPELSDVAVLSYDDLGRHVSIVSAGTITLNGDPVADLRPAGVAGAGPGGGANGHAGQPAQPPTDALEPLNVSV